MNLTEHLLTCLAEECAETQQAITKALRFGLDDGSPDRTTTNAQDIAKELNDIVAVVEMLAERGIIKGTWDRPAIERKMAKVLEYAEYAKERGTLTITMPRHHGRTEAKEAFAAFMERQVLYGPDGPNGPEPLGIMAALEKDHPEPSE